MILFYYLKYILYALKNNSDSDQFEAILIFIHLCPLKPVFFAAYKIKIF